MMQTDWKKELCEGDVSFCIVGRVEGLGVGMDGSCVHVASEELDLEGHDGFGDPDHGEDAAEDERALVVAGVDREKER